jgi:hypothetical protein
MKTRTFLFLLTGLVAPFFGGCSSDYVDAGVFKDINFSRTLTAKDIKRAVIAITDYSDALNQGYKNEKAMLKAVGGVWRVENVKPNSVVLICEFKRFDYNAAMSLAGSQSGGTTTTSSTTISHSGATGKTTISHGTQTHHTTGTQGGFGTGGGAETEVWDHMQNGENVADALKKTILKEYEVRVEFVIVGRQLTHRFDSPDVPKITLKTIRLADKVIAHNLSRLAGERARTEY